MITTDFFKSKNIYTQTFHSWGMILCICSLFFILPACENELDNDKKQLAERLSLALQDIRQKHGGVKVGNIRAATHYAEIMQLLEDRYLYEYDEEFLFDQTIKGINEKVDMVPNLSDNEIIEIGLKAALGSLDKYSTYFTKAEFLKFNSTISGIFGGIGIEVRHHAKGLEVTNVFHESPAERAGLAVHDVITKAGSIELTGKDMASMVNLLRGRVNSILKIRVAKNTHEDKRAYNIEKQVDLTLKREMIHAQSVNGVHLNQLHVGYIAISHFNDQTGRDLVKAMKAITEADPALKGWVIDVRNNPGGVFSQALIVSDAFLSQGEIVHIVSKGSETSYDADKIDHSDAKPLIVLMNVASASAAEIFAGVIKDQGRGLLIGEKTYGKGLVQGIFPLKTGAGIKLTTSEYYSPLHHPVGVGIDPNVFLQDNPDTPKDEVYEHALSFFVSDIAMNKLPKP